MKKAIRFQNFLAAMATNFIAVMLENESVKFRVAERENIYFLNNRLK